MEYVILDASIECNGAQITARKIVRQSILNIPNVGQCKKYKCSRNSEAKIIKELFPKEHIINERSALNLGDEIRADTITLFVNNIKDSTLEKAPNTGRHNSQHGSTECFTHAIITTPFPNLKKVNDIKQVLPEAKKQLQKGKDRLNP